MKPWRTFGVLERISVDDFDMIKLTEDVFSGNVKTPLWRKDQWTLQLGGQVVFSLPLNTVASVGPYSEKGCAERLFQHMLDMRAAFGSIAYERGKDSVRQEIAEILAVRSA